MPALPLPTREIAELLDARGIDSTWLSLITTHAQSYPEHRANLLLTHPDYHGAALLDTDLLAGRSVGQISVLYEFSLAHIDPTSRKQSGQYFTPDDVAEFMATHVSLFPKNKTWLDPCAGGGNLAHALAAQQRDPEAFLANKLVLIDRDPLALLIARALLFLHFHKNDETLLNKMSANHHARDFLADEPLPAFDYAIANPPYAPTAADPRFITAPARDLYAYFLERLTRDAKGFITVTPQSFTHATKFQTLRRTLLNTYPSLSLYCFDNVPNAIFSGIKFGSTNTNMTNSVRACITIARPGKPEHLITPLMRWATAERASMFTTIPSLLCEAPFTETMFPKNFAALHDLLTTVTGEGYQPLREVLCDAPTRWALTVPSTPRYFAPAVQRTLNRTSFHTIYFPDQTTRDRYYPFLNSSLLYWWWRINDGGMSLSRENLINLPIPVKPREAKKLTERLLTSEQENMVIKMNAGKPIENIKHPAALLHDLNTWYFGPETAAALMKTHKNSYLPD